MEIVPIVSVNHFEVTRKIQKIDRHECLDLLGITDSKYERITLYPKCDTMKDEGNYFIITETFPFPREYWNQLWNITPRYTSKYITILVERLESNLGKELIQKI